jgi:hypothetical protein
MTGKLCYKVLEYHPVWLSPLSYLRSSYFVPSVMRNSLTKASLLPSDALSKGQRLGKHATDSVVPLLD